MEQLTDHASQTVTQGELRAMRFCSMWRRAAFDDFDRRRLERVINGHIDVVLVI